MADDGPQGSSGGFSLTKRYGPLPAWGWGLVGGVGVYAVYRFWQNRQSASSAATTAASSTAATQAIDYAPEISALQAEVQQLQQGEGGEAVSKPVEDNDNDTGGKKKPPPAGKKVRIPDVAGKRVAFAVDELYSEGLRPVTNPLRNPKDEYVATGTAPKAGSEVARGTRVVISVRHLGKQKKPASRVRDIPGGPERKPRARAGAAAE